MVAKRTRASGGVGGLFRTLGIGCNRREHRFRLLRGHDRSPGKLARKVGGLGAGNVAVVGAGPAGLSAAVTAALMVS